MASAGIVAFPGKQVAEKTFRSGKEPHSASILGQMSTIRLICLPLATISWELNPAYVNAIALKYEVSSTSFWPFLFLPPLIAMSSFPLQPYEVKGRNHAIASTVGFLILLPIGVLVPRYCRTFTKRCVSLCSMTLCNIFS